MNAKTLSILLLLVVVIGLGGAWWWSNEEAEKKLQAVQAQLVTLTNEVKKADSKVTELKSVNVRLETDLEDRAKESRQYSNQWASAKLDLSRAEAQAKAAAAANAAARAEIEKQNSKINELAGQKDDLSKKMDGLNGEIASLNTQIKDTEDKLAASEGDRAALEKDLKRLTAEKAELERKFNDLALLKKQVQKLKDELSVSRRLDFIRRGLYGFDKKGAEVLSEGVRPKDQSSNIASGIEINATVGTGGGATVEVRTNTPPKAP